MRSEETTGQVMRCEVATRQVMRSEETTGQVIGSHAWQRFNLFKRNKGMQPIGTGELQNPVRNEHRTNHHMGANPNTVESMVQNPVQKRQHRTFVCTASILTSSPVKFHDVVAASLPVVHGPLVLCDVIRVVTEFVVSRGSRPSVLCDVIRVVTEFTVSLGSRPSVQPCAENEHPYSRLSRNTCNSGTIIRRWMKCWEGVLLGLRQGCDRLPNHIQGSSLTTGVGTVCVVPFFAPVERKEISNGLELIHVATRAVCWWCSRAAISSTHRYHTSSQTCFQRKSGNTTRTRRLAFIWSAMS
jgi:hypothetical protein